jgi:hypothetical protein
MKKLFIFLFLLGIFAFSANAQQWVNFTSATPKAPELNLFTSNAQTVSFEVTIPGIYTMDTIVNGIAFTRLFLSGGSATNPVGFPELPVLKYKVAIPECSGTNITCNVISSKPMSSCWVYPVPQFVPVSNPQGFVEYESEFAFNSAAYNCFK